MNGLDCLLMLVIWIVLTGLFMYLSKIRRGP